ncbi:hypothetical protein VTK26DRAFT_3291 [Humicola hyalothermophila]
MLAPVTATGTFLGPQPLTKRASAPPVTVSGNAFWRGTTRFYVRGIDYQPGGASAMRDPLADKSVCERDLAQFRKLGINTVRVYTVDNSAPHDECMRLLADAGTYVVVDANNPLYSLDRLDPAASYNAAYLRSVFATVDAFARYDNTLAFLSGNEVVNDRPETAAAARYVKAVTRDIRRYLRARGHRAVPVGYSAADVAQTRMQMAWYMNCGPEEERSDFFAFNDYSWCNSDFVTAGWDQKVKNFTGYGIPIFLSEYGCNTNGRDFGEMAALMSGKMTSVYSGGVMYEYSLEENGYGIVKIPDPRGSVIEEQADFAKLAKALRMYPPPPGDGGFTRTTHAVACPTADAGWLVDTQSLPAMPAKAEEYMANGAGPGPGLSGKGSQNAGDGTEDGEATSGSGAVGPSPTESKNEAGNMNVNLDSVEITPVIFGVLLVICSLTMSFSL